jgi:hypothetical protein
VGSINFNTGMFKKCLYIIYWVSIISLIILPNVAFAPLNKTIVKVSSGFVMRQVKNKQMVTIKGEIFYNTNGNMVTHFSFPQDYVLLANVKGEAKMYITESNTVKIFQNTFFSSSTSPFYYFLNGKTTDMGLNTAGYSLISSKVDKETIITYWEINKPDMENEVKTIQLVHKKTIPVYMDYRNVKGEVLRKMYYYDYTTLEGITFPQAFTEILYEGKDSSVSKTTYAGFKINEAANSSYFDFKIPVNAKLEK